MDFAKKLQLAIGRKVVFSSDLRHRLKSLTDNEYYDTLAELIDSKVIGTNAKGEYWVVGRNDSQDAVQ